jgi:hypothetical protein
MESFSEYSNELSNSIKAEQVFDELRDIQLLRKTVLHSLLSEFIRLIYAAL